MSITIDANSLEGNSDWELRVNNSTKVEKMYSTYLEGNSNTPAFVAHAQGGWTYYTVGVWNDMFGSKFPSGWGGGDQRAAGSYGWDSDGRYYAPVSGWYYFHCDVYMYCDTNQTSNYVHLLFGRNNAQNWNTSNRTPYIIHGHGGPRASAYHPHGPNISAVMYLTQGQYTNIKIYHNTSGNTRYHGNHTFFCGHLLD